MDNNRSQTTEKSGTHLVHQLQVCLNPSGQRRLTWRLFGIFLRSKCCVRWIGLVSGGTGLVSGGTSLPLSRRADITSGTDTGNCREPNIEWKGEIFAVQERLNNHGNILDKFKSNVVKEGRLQYTKKSDVVPEVTVNKTAPQSDKEVSSSVRRHHKWQ